MSILDGGQPYPSLTGAGHGLDDTCSMGVIPCDQRIPLPVVQRDPLGCLPHPKPHRSQPL